MDLERREEMKTIEEQLKSLAERVQALEAKKGPDKETCLAIAAASGMKPTSFFGVDLTGDLTNAVLCIPSGKTAPVETNDARQEPSAVIELPADTYDALNMPT